jgi:hypothetical protein
MSDDCDGGAVQVPEAEDEPVRDSILPRGHDHRAYLLTGPGLVKCFAEKPYLLLHLASDSTGSRRG